MPGPDLDVVVEREQAVVKGAEYLSGPLTRLDPHVGARDVADEQRVAGEDGPCVAAAARVVEHEGGVLRAVAGRVHRLDVEVAEA